MDEGEPLLLERPAAGPASMIPGGAAAGALARAVSAERPAVEGQRRALLAGPIVVTGALLALFWSTQGGSRIDAGTARASADDGPAVVLAAAAGAVPDGAKSDRPHIVFVLVDDMGANDIGYSSTDLRGLTPTLDELAESGVRLSAYYSMHMCTPARAALYTGRYPSTIGMQYENVKPDSPWGLPRDVALLPQLLRAHGGYRTHLVGKWDQGHYTGSYLPTARGFDSFYGYLSDEINYFQHTYPSAFNGTYFHDFTAIPEPNGACAPVLAHGGTFSSVLYTAHLRALAMEHAAAGGDAAVVDGGAYHGVPLFLLYAAQNVHGPLDTPPKELLTDDEWAQLDGFDSLRRRSFGGLVATLDRSIGELRQSFTELGLWSNTLMVLVSDNGGCRFQGGSNLPYRGGKHFLFEGGVRVPGFIHSANASLVPAAVRGSTYAAPIHVTDWLPTLLDVGRANASDWGSVDAATRDAWDGVSQWAALRGEVAVDAAGNGGPRSETLLSLTTWTSCCDAAADDVATTCSGFGSDCTDQYTAVVARMATMRAAIRVGEMKLVLNEFEIPWFTSCADAEAGGAYNETAADGNSMNNCGDNPGSNITSFLFNLTADPTEDLNLFGDARFADARTALEDRLHHHQMREVKSIWQPESTTAWAAWTSNGGYITPWGDDDDAV